MKTFGVLTILWCLAWAAWSSYRIVYPLSEEEWLRWLNIGCVIIQAGAAGFTFRGLLEIWRR